MYLSLIVCTDSKGGIGYNGSIPWLISEDLNHFKNVTSNRYIIAGRVTWESIPDRSGKGIKLPNRTPIVITSNLKYKVPNGVAVPDLHSALRAVPNNYYDEIIIIGGAQLYKDSLPYVTKIYLTEIDKNFNCDRFFIINHSKWKDESVSDWKTHSDEFKYRFKILVRK